MDSWSGSGCSSPFVFHSNLQNNGYSSFRVEYQMHVRRMALPSSQ